MKQATGVLAVGAIAVLAATLWWLRPEPSDSFDYVAAFEQPPATAAIDGVNVLTLTGEDPATIEQLLGPTERCEQALHSLRCRYAQSPVEIVFIAGRADWFTIRSRGQDIPFTADGLAYFGLPLAEPDEVTARESVWRDLAGLKEVRLVGDENGVAYARIKAITP